MRQTKKKFTSLDEDSLACAIGYPRRERNGRPSRGQQIADEFTSVVIDSFQDEFSAVFQFERRNGGPGFGFHAHVADTREGTEQRMELICNYIAFLLDTEVRWAKREVRRRLLATGGKVVNHA